MSAALLLLLAQAFQQGPMQVGHTETLAGVVIGMRQQAHGHCALVLADQPGKQLPGGGRFVVCDAKPFTRIHERLTGQFQQIDTTQWRVGPRRRVLPVYRAAP